MSPRPADYREPRANPRRARGEAEGAAGAVAPLACALHPDPLHRIGQHTGRPWPHPQRMHPTSPFKPQRRALLLSPALAALAAPLAADAAGPAAAPKVLRVAFSSAETSFDPARISDQIGRA